MTRNQEIQTLIETMKLQNEALDLMQQQLTRAFHVCDVQTKSLFLIKSIIDEFEGRIRLLEIAE